MRFLFILILFSILCVSIRCRPSQTDENNESQEEIEYEEDNSTPDQENIEGTRFRDEDPTSQEVEQDRRLLDLNRNTYLEKNEAEDRVVRTNPKIAGDKPARTRDIRNDRHDSDKLQGYVKGSRPNRYMENYDSNEQLEAVHHPNNRDVSNYKSSRMHNYQIMDSPLKRTADSRPVPTEEGELLFDNNRDQVSKANKDYDMEPYELSQRQLSYNEKQYCNDMRQENKAINTNNRNDRVYYSRDRRAAKKSTTKETKVDSNNNNIGLANESSEKVENENEEMAIRRHIKKLSEDELQELLNSLTDEKRALLKKIIDDTDASENNDNINKREITKKGGAVEINGYVDLSQSESSKIQGASSIDVSTEYSTQNSGLSEATQSQKQIYKNSESKIELKNNSENNNSDQSVDDFIPNNDARKIQANVASAKQMSSNANKKREINVGDVSPATCEDPELESDENPKVSQGVVGYFSTQDDDMSPSDDDQPRFYDTSKMYKRDIEKQSELENKLKSLEESFPNPESYDDSAPYSGPLIRVKRKDFEQSIKKRGIIPDSKVGFFSYKDTDDMENEEGSEFDDDGFYDPTPNFVSKENNKNAETHSQQAAGDSVNCMLNTADRAKSSNADTNSGTISLGSDTDNVLSGVEGVDENLMLTSGNRNRRRTDENVSENVDDTNLIQSLYGKTNDDAKVSSNINNLNVPNYQEGDSFGGLTHNYEGDLGRYKRIRRVKQSHVIENVEPATNN